MPGLPFLPSDYITIRTGPRPSAGAGGVSWSYRSSKPPQQEQREREAGELRIEVVGGLKGAVQLRVNGQLYRRLQNNSMTTRWLCARDGCFSSMLTGKFCERDEVLLVKVYYIMPHNHDLSPKRNIDFLLDGLRDKSPRHSRDTITEQYGTTFNVDIAEKMAVAYFRGVIEGILSLEDRDKTVENEKKSDKTYNQNSALV